MLPAPRSLSFRHRPVTSGAVDSTFYEPAGPDCYSAMPATAGPWSPRAQHGGPPSALAALALERYQPDGRQRLARVAVDILRPVPVGTVCLRTRLVRPGRRVALLETVMEADGQEVLHARGWRIERPAGDVPVIGADAAPPPVPAEQGKPSFGGVHDGYLAAIEWRFVSGRFDQPAPASAWTRPRIPLLAGGQDTPMARALLVADSGSGLGSVLDPARFQYINVDLTVVLTRDPAGEWLLMESATETAADGTGLSRTRLSDSLGRIGRGWQTLLLAPH